MGRRWIAVLATLVLVGIGAPVEPDVALPRGPKQPGVAHRGLDVGAVHGATVRGPGTFGFGTVFALRLGDRHRLVSAAHVVDGTALVPGCGGGRFAPVPGADLASAPLDAPPGAVALVPTADPVVAGELVLVAGHPLGGALTVRRGRVVTVAEGSTFGQRAQVVVIEADVEPGFSGGPVVDADGAVVAVMFAVEDRTGVGLAHPVGALASRALGARATARSG